jgi:hypothetical protein
LDNVWLFFSCFKNKHFFLFNYVPHLFLLTCVKFYGKKINNNDTLTHICLLPSRISENKKKSKSRFTEIKICHFWEFHKYRWINKRHKWRVTRIKKKYPNHRSWIKIGERENKMHAMRGSKDLYSRILGGSEKGSEGQTQLQYF